MALTLQNMCRTCMLNESKQDETSAVTQMVSILTVPEDSKEELSLMELLKTTVPQLKIKKNDKLPKIVCLECSDKIIEIYRFQQNCFNVEQKYFKMLEKHDFSDPFDESEEDLPIAHLKAELGNAFDEDLHEPLNGSEDYVTNILKTELGDPFAEENCLPSDKSLLLDDVKMQAAIDDLSGDSDWDKKSDSDWEEETKPSKNKTTTKISAKKRKSDFEINNTNKNSKSKTKKQLKDIPEMEMPLQNEDGSISCQECEAILENVTRWQEHMLEHRPKGLTKAKKKRKTKNPSKTIQCEHCNKEFSRLIDFTNHQRVHTGESPFLCIECGKSFKFVSTLNTHMLRHKGEKNVQCPHCPKKFVCTSGLYNHMLVHTNKKKSFVCDTCGKAFHMAYMLKKHNLSHNNIRNYPCEYCDMQFFTAAKQRRHTRTHTGEKPYRCKYCERAFAQSNDHIKHLRQHLGDNVYFCELCPLRFPMARDLRTHFASHKDDDEETRTRNLEARLESEKNFKIKLSAKDV